MEEPAPNSYSADSEFDYVAYRSSEREQERIRELFNLIPASGGSALDIGAREGFLSLKLIERFDSVTALDLTRPSIDHPAVVCVEGDASRLPFPDRSFDLVLCAEVLEHIPPEKLLRVCAELARVTRGHLVIGVPYQQDIRVGRTTCVRCGGKNPPWGHVNIFDELKLEMLFPTLATEKVRYVGETRSRTNPLSTWFYDRAGNPYGTYGQTESCGHCGSRLMAPDSANIWGKGMAAAAHWLQRAQSIFIRSRPNWIHVLYRQQ
jgi:hypothetical protein